MKILNKNAQYDIEYYPFPIAQIKNYIDPKYIDKLVKSFPDISLFDYIEDKKFGNKYALSEVNNRKKYFKFLKSNKIWNDFFLQINTIEFQKFCFDKLSEKKIALNHPIPTNSLQKIKYLINHYLYRIGKVLFNDKIYLGSPKIKTTLEFQIMSANGNYLLPHTDSKRKILTFCLNLTDSNWKKEYGGGFSSFIPKDISNYYNFNDEFLQFNQCDTIKDYDFEFNQVNLFIKTFNSLHGVKQMQGPKTSYRKSINFSFIYER